MLRDRGYIVSDRKLNQTIQDFKDNFNGTRDSLNMLVTKRSQIDPNDPNAAAN